MTAPTKTREQWLLQAVKLLTPDFKRAGVELPPVRVSVGWPGGRGNKQNVIGQCWMPSAVEDGVPAIFISPVLTEKSPERILGVLIHELVHAVGNPGHRGGFAKLAANMGLIAPWPATGESDILKAHLEKLAKKLGPFPHAVITPVRGLGGVGPERPPVQGTRMLKVQCPSCGYIVRTTRKWLEVGNPSCPEGDEMQEVRDGE